jgi:hypothetical protein
MIRGVAEFSFPADLIAAAAELHAARDEHARLCRSLPKNRGLPDVTGAAGTWQPGDPPIGWAQQHADRERVLRQRVLTLAEQVHTHPYWETVRGPQRVDARAALQQPRPGPAPEPSQLEHGGTGNRY